MATLVVPGVRVEARFDVLPPLPAPAGILGAVGIVDRVPAGGLVSFSKASEMRDLLGPGTGVTMPQVVHALANGVSEVVVSAVTGGKAARLTLNNRDGNPAVLLRARSAGTWANAADGKPESGLRVEVRETTDTNGVALRVAIRLLRDGRLVESFSDLRVAPGEPDDLFETLNRGSAYVVALDPGTANVTPAPIDATFNAADAHPAILVKGAGDKSLFEFVPADGASPNGLRVVLTVAGANIGVAIHQNGLQEVYRNLTVDPDDDDYLPAVLATQSRLVRTRAVPSLAADKRLPAATSAPVPLADGESPTVDAYRTAIDLLADDTRVDLLLAAVEPNRADADVRQIHQALVAHALTMTDAGAPRIAFGSVTAAEQPTVSAVRDHASAARSRRFVLVSPAGAEGAVAGVVGRMNPHDSPTFKLVPLFDVAPAAYRESQLNQLLGPTVNAFVVQDRRGRGVVALKGIDTTGDQVSVTRVADQCIRETKAISENFIGELNTEAARVALRQQIIATFTRMERAGALVPSTDGKDPAFVVDVYSTQQDFAQGIVRIDIAVRPVRAIDYIYATIRVKN